MKYYNDIYELVEEDNSIEAYLAYDADEILYDDYSEHYFAYEA